MVKTVRIGCGAGFWGDTPQGPRQLVEQGNIDYLMLDYLAEVTMSILAKVKSRKPDLGYAPDFVGAVMKPLAAQIAAKGIRVVVNAGGVNLEGCRAALQAVLDEQGINLKIATVAGDDLSDRIEDLKADNIKEMFSGADWPGGVASVNAYLGAFPIARALDEGADIVLTGRVVDSALALAPLIHEFGWQKNDHDKLAMGSLAGHVIECGAQATGGLFTDWRDVQGWDRMGFPIAECHGDGRFEISKPEGTGGLISTASVAEQIVYEVGDPAAYLLPDVTCDFSTVRLSQKDSGTVLVEGARGAAPTGSYKVSCTYADGYRAGIQMMLGGWEAAAKAQAVGEAILSRTRNLIQDQGFADFSETLIEVLGAESTYGANSRAQAAREVVLRISVRHPEKAALQIFGAEIYAAGTAMAQGLTGFSGGRPVPVPVVRLFSFLLDKGQVPIELRIGDACLDVTCLPASGAGGANRATKTAVFGLPDAPKGTRMASVPLLAIAHGRSGDKGDIANIGILARRAEFVPILQQQLSADVVHDYFAHVVTDRVERFDWPGLNGFNFLLHGGLGGGGMASLRNDAQGKAYAQMLLDLIVQVPAEWLDAGGLLENQSRPHSQDKGNADE